jgi:hypothetical protein
VAVKAAQSALVAQDTAAPAGQAPAAVAFRQVAPAAPAPVQQRVPVGHPPGMHAMGWQVIGAIAPPPPPPPPAAGAAQV